MEVITPTTFLNYPQKNISIPFFMCYPLTFSGGSGILTQSDPLVYPIPLLVLQLTTIIVISRLIAMLIRPLRQPRYISEIMGGIILGPSVMGSSPMFRNMFFPSRSLVILDTLGQFGLIYCMFIVGIEAEKFISMQKAMKVWYFTMACIVPTFALGSLASLAIHHRLYDNTNQVAFLIFLGAALADNSFHTLVRILSELKLVNSETGQLALASSMLTHNLLSGLMGFAIYLGQSDGDALASVWACLSGLTFFLLSMVILKPVMRWVEKQIPEGADHVDELYTSMILVAAIVWALIADVLGAPSIFGGLVIGLSVPSGPLSEALIERVENFNNGIFMPLFFLVIGLRINLQFVKNVVTTALLTTVTVLGVVFKVVAGALLASIYKMSPSEGVSFGLMMNTKGLFEVINLSICSSKRVLGDESFTIVMMLSLVMNFVVTSLIRAVAGPWKRIVSYKRRSIMWGNMDSELRFLTCAHVLRQVPGLIALLDLSHPTKPSPIFVYALHLIQLTGRTTAFLLNSTNEIATYFNIQSRVKVDSDHVFHAFDSYQQYACGVSVQCLTCIAPYATMHEDVIYTAAERHAAIILLPFHKHASVDGTMIPEHPAIRTINQNVLDSASCSVGILVDRGLSGHRNNARRVTLFFFGGADDREGLALVSRMAENPAVEVTVLRFLLEDKAHSSSKMERVLMVTGDDDDSLKDEDCISAFRERWRGGTTVGYVEIGVNSAEETVEHIRGIGGEQELFIVGRGKGRESPMTAGMTQWSECPELGPIGDLLASPDFRTVASVLVLQQGGGAPSIPEMHMDPQVRFHREQVGVMRPYNM